MRILRTALATLLVVLWVGLLYTFFGQTSNPKPLDVCIHAATAAGLARETRLIRAGFPADQAATTPWFVSESVTGCLSWYTDLDETRYGPMITEVRRLRSDHE